MLFRSVQVKESAAWITEQQRVDLQWLLMEGWPIAPAAQELRIGKSSAYRIANELKARLAAEGRNLPRPVAANLREVPRHLKSWKLAHAGNNDVATATKPATAAEGPSQTPTRAEAPPPVEANALRTPRRPMTFEEQLAAIRAGAGLTRKFTPSPASHAITLGGVSGGML